MKSSDQYVFRFIQDRIVNPKLSINAYTETKPVHLSFVEHFQANGWSAQSIPDHPKRHRMFTPEGEEFVTVRGLSATRHPAATTRICRYKHFTKKMLDLAGVPNPVGAEFLSTERNIAVEYFQKMPKPIVVKPTNASSSKGVTTGVEDLGTFQRAWTQALAVGNERTKVLLEEFIEGIEVRAYVINNTVAAASVRVPPFVVGDGQSAVAELLEAERLARDVNPKVRSRINPDWDFVGQSGHSATSVPDEGEILILHPFKTAALGAQFFDVTDELSDENKDIAVRAVKAIPHLEIAGIDLLMKDITDSRSTKVLEVNTTPATDMHRYPTFGTARPVEKFIADFYHTIYPRTSRV